MKIEVVDVEDREGFHEWFGPQDANHAERFPGEPGWTEDELHHFIANLDDHDNVLGVARGDRGEVLGSFGVQLPLRDNPHAANLAVDVLAAHEGTGIGRALLEHSEGIARERGRETFIARTVSADDLDTCREARFARAAGYTRARRDARRLLSLPDDVARFDELEAQAALHATDYDIVTWIGPCPDAYVAGRVRLATAMSNDAPRGELELEAREWDEERLRSWEQLLLGGDRALVCAGALHRSTGELVAVTEIGTPIEGETLGRQFLTVVAKEHRGHRLGVLVKLANLRALIEFAPTATQVVTWNASENGAMIRVNEALGCVLSGGGDVWQKLHG